MTLRRFQLQPFSDPSGDTPPGILTEGVQFPSGLCALGVPGSTTAVIILSSIKVVLDAYVAGDQSRLVWLDLLHQRRHALSPREIEVLHCLARGWNNRRIARALVVSDQTVHSHVSAILRKLYVRSRTAAVAYGYCHGLLQGEEGYEYQPS